MENRKRSPVTLGSLALIPVALILGGCASSAGMGSTPANTSASASRNVGEAVASWPAKQRETIMMMTQKYGAPSVIGERLVVWYNTGPFVMTSVARDEVQHNFPMPHPDYLAQTVKYKMPGDKLDELFEYDGSVWFHRTRGELSAQCDVEEMNMLALNLAHDIAMGKRTVADARAFYGKTAMAFKNGDKSSPYVRGLMFPMNPGAADPDRALQM